MTVDARMQDLSKLQPFLRKQCRLLLVREDGVLMSQRAGMFFDADTPNLPAINAPRRLCEVLPCIEMWGGWHTL